MKTKDKADTRRDFLKKAAYAAPVILTLKAVPAFAKNGSGRGNNGGGGDSCPFGDC
jgi:hypothetical protein